MQPEIADIDFTGLKLKKTLYQASDEEVDVQIQMMQKNLAKREPIDEERPAQAGDFVQVDYEGFKDGKPFEETKKTENFVIKLGDAHISEDFDKGVIGMNPGEEKEITASFPTIISTRNWPATRLISRSNSTKSAKRSCRKSTTRWPSNWARSPPWTRSATKSGRT